MREFQVDGRTISAYLAVPEQGSGPGVLVLHAWWGLTEPFRQVCDRLAEAGFVALAPDLYHGKTTASVEEAQALGTALDQDVERWRGDIAGAVQVLRQHKATHLADGRGKLAFVGFSLGGAYALDMSVTLAEEIAAVVTFYASYPGLDYRNARPHTSATSRRMIPSSRLSRSRRWSRRSRLRGDRSPSIRIRGPNTGSLRRIALSMTPRLLTLPGSVPSSSCINGLIERSPLSME